ncbi:MAG: endonuclease domain-containing protein, partial [Bacteroidota bacterium]
VDFFCYEESLVIEVDGSIHNDPIKKYNDISKDKFLINKGFNVLRIMNAEVFADTDRVVNKIINEFKENK